MIANSDKMEMPEHVSELATEWAMACMHEILEKYPKETRLVIDFFICVIFMLDIVKEIKQIKKQSVNLSK